MRTLCIILIMTISIHAPRGGSDIKACRQELAEENFNPRSPWGERLPGISTSLRNLIFQSTLPVGGATAPECGKFSWRLISIHAPRGGSDRILNSSKFALNNFNPRSPWGERRHNYGGFPLTCKFQSTLPVGGATFTDWRNGNTPKISIHAPRGGSDSKDAQFWVHIFGEGI